MAGDATAVNSLIGAMLRLQGSINELTRTSENIQGNQSQVAESNALATTLAKASTSPVLRRSLEQVIRKGLGGTATPEIRQNLARAGHARQQYMRARAAAQKTHHQIVNTATQLPQAKNKRQLAAMYQRITNLNTQMQQHQRTATKQRAAMNAALNRGRRAALSKGSQLGKIKPISKVTSSFAMLGKAAGVVGAAFGVIGAVVGAASTAVEFFTDKIKESGAIIAKYSHFSIGGLHASATMYIRDIQRNIYAGRALSDAMMEFAKANSDMKDSWKNAGIVLDKMTLSIGTVGSKIGTVLGKLADPMVKMFDRFMGGLAKGELGMEAIALAAGPLGIALSALAKVAGWKTLEDEMQEARARVARRKMAFAGGDLQGAIDRGQLKPGDVHPLEMLFGGLRGNNKQNPPQNPVKPILPPGQIQPFPKINPGGGGGGRNNQAQGIPGQGGVFPGGPNPAGFPNPFAPPANPIPVNPRAKMNVPRPRIVPGAGMRQPGFDPRQLDPNVVQVPGAGGKFGIPINVSIDDKIKIVERKIRFEERRFNDAIAVAERLIKREKKLEEGGITPAEQVEIDRIEETFKSVGNSQRKSFEERQRLEQEKEMLMQEKAKAEKARVGWSNPWTDPYPGKVGATAIA